MIREARILAGDLLVTYLGAAAIAYGLSVLGIGSIPSRRDVF